MIRLALLALLLAATPARAAVPLPVVTQVCQQCGAPTAPALTVTFTQANCAAVKEWHVLAAAISAANPAPTIAHAWPIYVLANLPGVCATTPIRTTFPAQNVGRVRFFVKAVPLVADPTPYVSQPLDVALPQLGPATFPAGCEGARMIRNATGAARYYFSPLFCER